MRDRALLFKVARQVLALIPPPLDVLRPPARGAVVAVSFRDYYTLQGPVPWLQLVQAALQLQALK